MNLDDKVILVTGGTGSFGRKFTDILLRHHSPAKLIIFSRDELKQSEMKKIHDQPNIRYFVGDVRDKPRLDRAMNGVDIVVHAAALKQVPACEYNPFEAVKTNIHGAENIINASIDAGVEKVVALSTDKAVNPINLYGATKLCAEKLFVNGNAYSGLDGTRFSCVRYGNVVGSRGSVIPLFLKMRETGQVTVTDERMTRFWISLEEGVRLVMHALEHAHGGEIFVPKIPSMNIMDLVEAIAPDCKVKHVGIRPGEKLHELLISPDEAWHTVEYDERYVVKPAHPWWIDTNHAGAKPVDNGFEYRSDTNPEKLTVSDLAKLVEALDLGPEHLMPTAG